MSEPDISPLARRLAEENNVEWRVLRGSGGSGKVVERDVLGYLARVMAGDEDLDPAPEPLPSGMQAWPEDDVTSYRQEHGGAGQSAGLDDIQRQLSASQRPADTVSDTSHRFPDGALSADSDDLDDTSEDIFLFDDDDDVVVADDVAAQEDADFADESFRTTGVADDDLDDDMVVAAEDGAAEHPDEDVGVWTAGVVDTVDPSAPDIFGEPADSGALQDDGSLELFADATAEPSERADASLEIPSEDDLTMDFSADSAVPTDPVPTDPVLTDPALTDPALANPESTGPVAADGFAAGDPSEARPDHGDAHAGTVMDDVEAPDPVGTSEPWEAPHVDHEPVLPATGPAALTHDMPLVSFGSLLRRHLDLSSLTGAQLAVSQEFGLDEPLPPTAFLVRAAAKALAEEGEDVRPLLLACFTAGGMRLANLNEAPTGPFRALHDAVSSAAGHVSADGAALVVADMSGLEIDEAVLNLGVPVLTLGRILYDNQRGSYKSTLTMSGDVAPERGARLLAKVAELLDSPVRLVL